MRGIAGAIGLRPGEGNRTLRLLGFVFLFTATVVLARSAQRDIFLAAYPRARIADAFLYSALFSALASLGVTALAARLGLVRMVHAVLWSGAVLFAVGWVSIRVAPQAGPMAVYIVVEVLLSLLLNQGWAVASEALDVRAAKRLLPVVGLGAGVAWTLGGFAVGALGRVVPSSTLLLASPVLLILASLMLRWIAARDVDSRGEPPREVQGLWASLGDGLRYITREPLMRILAAIITVELVVERITDFQLLSAAQERFAGEAGGVASFMGLFYGVTGAVTLLAPLLFSGKVLSQFGSTRTLLAAQAWVLLASGLFLAFPGFAVVVLLTGGDRIFKQALSAPARSQILGAVPAVRRSQANALLRGVVAGLFSAVAALLLKALPSGVPIHWLSIPSIALVAVLLVLTWQKLRKSYVLALQHSVDHRKLDLDDDARELDGEQVATLAAELESSEPDRVSFAVTLLGGAKPEVSRPLLLRALLHAVPEVRAEAVTALARNRDPRDVGALATLLEEEKDDAVVCAALRALAELGGEQAAERVSQRLSSPSPRVRALARACLARFEQLDAGTRPSPAGAAFAALLRSPAEEDRTAAAWALSQVELVSSSLAASFAPLLVDASVAVRQAALKAAGQFHEPAIVRSLVFALEDPSTAAAAFDAFPLLDDAGVSRVAQVLESAPDPVVSWTASALARAQPVQALDLLKRLLEHADPQVRHRASRALALRRRSREWAPPTSGALARALHAELARGYAYYATLIGLEGTLSMDHTDPGVGYSSERRFISGEIDSRIQETERRILGLISLVADPRIARLSHHLRDASPQVTARLLELLEQSLDAELAALVLPFLERQTNEARVKTASERFHVPDRFREDPLAGIIELNDPHLRRCALLVYGDRIAARYPELVNREEPLLPLVERIRFLRSVPLFKGLSPEDLMKLAEIAATVEHASGGTIFRKGDPGDVLCVVVRGQVEIRDQAQLIATQGPNDFFGELALFDHEPRSADAVAAQDTELLEIGGADLDALMERRPEIAREVIRVLARRLRSTTQAMLVRTPSSPNIPAVSVAGARGR